jgi:hypothetical protein
VSERVVNRKRDLKSSDDSRVGYPTYIRKRFEVKPATILPEINFHSM